MRLHDIAITVVAALAGLAAACASPSASARDMPVPPHAVIGVEESQLNADYWIQRQPHADRIVLDSTAIAAQNARLTATDPSVHELQALPATLDRTQVQAWVESMSARPDVELFDERGEPVPSAAIDDWLASTQIEAIPSEQATRYGLVTRRVDLRTFPTRQRVFDARGETDIDRFQESGLFPGSPVAIVHESRDGKWWFVVSPLYTAWVEKDGIAQGSAEQVFGYVGKAPYVVVTGASALTVFTPEQPAVSQLQLDMGTRVPLLDRWPADRPVNGQHPYTAHVIELPLRNADGSLGFTPALLPRNEDATVGYLPLTRANVIRQGFKFLGERYGWGHSYNARDCSGFVSEIYRSVGVQLPRNTRDQATSPALNRVDLDDVEDRGRRMAAVRELQVGDLVYIPGHVMMVIGEIAGEPYVIHDTTGISYRGADGSVTRAKLNGVSVSPLTPLLFDDSQDYVDRITSIQRIRP
ncbi:SH3 domain-containing protein [Montanilutibacter psychrotolerans]|uniref:NlpC-P60 family protein n=1 Tax=Montanilutibacter psychrotolerans TaxID=1327343 RepID=A0A3M8T151_9GAMM|nr:SH3 domain-containing protein [Lysobacter psychrotolerans]RNF85396.1 NlpC-P60 family protein [Lysobacter psychrotolerans]